MQITEANLETVLGYVTFGDQTCQLPSGEGVGKILTLEECSGALASPGASQGLRDTEG